jgi:hypothetical protein
MFLLIAVCSCLYVFNLLFEVTLNTMFLGIVEKGHVEQRRVEISRR